MKNDVVRPTKKGFSDCKKICADYVYSYCAYPTCHALADTGVYGSFWIYSFCHFWRFHAVAICIPKRVSISKSYDITMCHTIFTESDSFIKIHFCMAIYAICCIVFELETLFMPGLGTSDIKLFAFMFLIVSVFIGIYLPIQYKFGYEKTKFAFGVIIMASPFILPLLMRAGNLNLNFLSMFSPYLVYGGIVLIGFAVLAISASLSIKIYDKADLA